MATLLPPPEIQFIDENGNPVAGGAVFFYVPNTTTPKPTWQDSGATILNTNPVILDAAGRAIIYGSGVYRAVVYDALGDLVYDQLTADTSTGGLAWGGTSTGTQNAQIIASSSFTSQDGQQISFIAGFTNSGALTVNGIAVLKDTGVGPTPLVGGEVVLNNAVSLIYDAGRGAFHMVQTPLVGVTLANITVTGSFTATGLVTNADLADVPTATIKGRVAASTGIPTDLTGTDATTILNAVVGDSGSGGTKGLAPAPGAGDAAANAFLHASGAWVAAQATPTSSTLPVGFVINGFNNTGGTIANGATIAGSNLLPVSINSSNAHVLGGALTGTWTNIFGATVGSMAGGLFVRTA